MTAKVNAFSVLAETLSVMRQMQCHLEDCSTALGRHNQMIVCHSVLSVHAYHKEQLACKNGTQVTVDVFF